MLNIKKLTNRIPFAARLYFFIDYWAVLCGLFSFFFFINLISFEESGIKNVITVVFLISLILAAFSAPAEYGLFRFLGIRGKKEAQILNDNIVGDDIRSDISDGVLLRMFSSLVRRPGGCAVSGLKYGLGVTIVSTGAAFIIGAKTETIVAVFTGPLIGTILLSIFAIFFAERFIFSVLIKCEKMIQERRLKAEKFHQSTLKSRFNYFIILYVSIFITTLSFVSDISLGVLGIMLVGLVMTIIAGKFLFSSIYDIFLEIENFAAGIPKKEKTFYVTGNLTKESINLSEKLNNSAEELYRARDEVEQKKAELDKFYKLTVGRELRMAELKNKIKELERKK